MAKISPLRPGPTEKFDLEDLAAAEPGISQRKDVVCVGPTGPSAPVHFAQPRPQAAFLAHLLAVAHRAPQMQEKRRAEPHEAANRYTAAGKAVPARPGLSLKRAV